VVDYTTRESLAAHFADKHADDRFDAVLDTVGIQDLHVHSPAYLKEKGLFLDVGVMAVAPTWRAFLGLFAMLANNLVYPSFLPRGVVRKYAFFSRSANEEDLRRIVELVEDGKLKVEIDSVWAMQDARGAYEVIDGKRARGKVVVKVQEV
jgi:NADPH:quinone reductase-like Zn-dependent oxidoreductase